MLKLDIEALEIRHCIEFKMNETGAYSLLVLFSKFFATPSQVWHAENVPAEEVDELISSVAYIRQHRYAGRVRVINDGTWFTAEAFSFSPFRFNCDEEGENGDRFLEILSTICTAYIGDPDLLRRWEELGR